MDVTEYVRSILWLGNHIDFLVHCVETMELRRKIVEERLVVVVLHHLIIPRGEGVFIGGQAVFVIWAKIVGAVLLHLLYPCPKIGTQHEPHAIKLSLL